MSDETGVTPEESTDAGGVSRRTILRLGAVGGAGAALAAAQGLAVPFLAQEGLLSADGAFAATSIALGDTALYIEKFPTSPLI
ncbi:MAG: copper oxidase, partial [Chloroflexota bacterium]|nr:copper oxidase [Chloroflexota bacterium]